MTAQTFQYSDGFAEKRPTIVVQNVNVEYETQSSSPEERALATPKQRLIGKILGRDPNVTVHSVKDVSFVAREGDSIGFLGVNGAGKSSLLRVVSGNESPKSGVVYASAQPALLGVSAALLPDLSGYENARLGCLAMGLTPAEAEEALPDIIDFTEIGEAIYRPMRSYSSGMGARLRFAISTVFNPEILIIDEALSTGDAAFQEKSKHRMDGMLDNSGTILLVSHSPNQVEQMCSRGIWMHLGEVIADGDCIEVAALYKEWSGYLRNDKSKANSFREEVQASYQPITIEVSGVDKLRRLMSDEI